ncbi:hypothetical protein KP509_11G065400 [Ceratopteris richardii]|uniref:DUF659 domain-containing protein n=1 Tax=Ceratopteris richardii TaxID=49495 RepID=A0A8T2TQL8_CERRI|nr:hypothetical protein KP509_11G065400 [Ceratopteris richardii]
MFIFEVLKDAIMDVGPTNVVQICMDNASRCVRASYLVEQEWSHIFYTICTCHSLDLLFEGIGALAWVKSVLTQAMKIVTFVTMKPSILALFKKFSAKDLIKPAQIRFAYMSAREIVNVCAPILHVLRLADREGVTMGFIYELIDRMIEKIGKLDGIDNVRHEEVKALCIGRWNILHSPLRAEAYILHPIWREICSHNDVDKQGVLFDELHIFKTMSGTFGRQLAKDPKRMHHGVMWRTKLLPKNTEKLVYIHTNLRLAMKIKEKGFEMQEATLEMIEKEKDDERLLQMQKNVEGEKIPLNSIASIIERYVHDDEDPSTHDDSHDVNVDIDDDDDEEADD